MTAAITMLPDLRTKARRGSPSSQSLEHNIARPVTLPLDMADLYREWQRALDAQFIANRKLKTARAWSDRSGFMRSADAAAYRVALAREAFVAAMKLEAENRR